MTTTTLKAQALKIATREGLPIYNIDFKTASDILNEVAEHKLHMRLLSARGIFDLPSDSRLEILRLAKRYNIPYKEESINYRELREEVDSYRHLLIRAKKLNIDWIESDYEPVYLRQLIEEADHMGFQELELNRSFYREAIRLT